MEMGIRILAVSSAQRRPGAAPLPRPVRSGREYLERRREQFLEAGQRARGVEEALAAVAAAFADLDLRTRVDRPSSGQALAVVAHLVHRHEVEAYRAHFEALRATHSGHLLVPSGPWAPYSFV